VAQGGAIVQFALIGDTHCGSKWCCEQELADFYDYAIGLGVTRFYHSGDIVAGYHAKWRSELLATGMDDQMAIAFDMLPLRQGATTHFITGNHCDKYHRTAGAAVGVHLERYFRERGRTDLRFIGGNRTTVEVAPGMRLGLQHPGGAGGRNLGTTIYGYLQEHPSWRDLDMYACGHFHRFDYAWRCGVHCFATPCFESSSVWGRGLRGTPDVGGIVVEVDGRDFALRRRLY
jgi:hypothetical protein